jgi:hypothetical protein
MFTLMGADGRLYSSPVKGTLGGNRADLIYGQMDCSAANRALNTGDGETYRKKRVFFANESTAQAAGYRPCGSCMRDSYLAWKSRKPGSDFDVKA